MQDKGCTPSFQKVQLSMSSSRFVAEACAPCLEYYLEERNLIRDRPVFRNQIQRVFDHDKLGQRRRTRNSFVPFAGEGGEGSVL